MNRLWMLLCLLFVVSISGCSSDDTILSTATHEKVDESDALSQENVKEKGSLEEYIYVYVSGCVKEPGVYKLDVTSRIVDAIEMAGGVTEDGDASGLAQAQTMSDGMTIYVPSHNEAQSQLESEDDGLVNINTADKERLMDVPGIGASKADAIIAYRTEHGEFTTIEDLMQISGIKQGVFDKIKMYIKVSG